MICACPNPNCRQIFKVPDNFAGKQATCPKCKKPFIIPKATKTIPTAVQVPAPKSAVQPPPSQPSPASQTGGNVPPIQPDAQTEGAGLKKAPVPPPLPISTTAQKAPGQIGPPPLPPKNAPKTQGAGKPPAIPGTVSTVAGNVINKVVGSLVRALCIRKLGFFLLAATAIGLLLFLLSYGLMKISMPSGSLDVEDMGSIIGKFVLVYIIIVIVAVGLTGVMVGGVAYLTHMEEQGRSVGIRDAFRFCGRKFGSLFGGAILFLIVVLLIFAVTNGFISLLSGGHSLGSLLAALLFLPHFVLNFVLLLTAVISVIIPCAIAVENIGPIVAISRFIACVRRDTGNLMVHFIITAFFSTLVMIMVCFVFVALFITIYFNSGGSMGMPGSTLILGQAGTVQGFDVEFASRDSYKTGERLVRNIPLETGIGNGTHNGKIMFGRERRDRSIFDLSAGQIKTPLSLKLRLFFAALVIASAVSYSAVFWIVSFTNYYRGVRPKISMVAPPRRAGP
jgi:hypothetical protein